MEEVKTKKVSRQRKAGNTPAPSGPIQQSGASICGHSGCETTCKVRYVGPTSALRDHHLTHVARGVAHVWTAAIVAGLAVVLTGAISYAAVEARMEGAQNPASGGMIRELARINKRLTAIEDILRAHVGEVAVPAPVPEAKSSDQAQKQDLGDVSCFKKCLAEPDSTTNSGKKTEATCRAQCYPKK